MDLEIGSADLEHLDVSMHNEIIVKKEMEHFRPLIKYDHFFFLSIRLLGMSTVVVVVCVCGLLTSYHHH